MNTPASDALRPKPGTPAPRSPSLPAGSGLFGFFKPHKPNEQTWWNHFPSDGILFLSFVAITLVGMYLRFFRIGYQSYWFDEGHTIERIAGSSQEMFRSLAKGQAFPPGWYWLLREWQRFLIDMGAKPYDSFSPGALRFIPALFGTLAIPAMYFLARQFTDKRGALLVMALTAVNPYLIYYSRDIKMYMALWFFIIWNTIFFFRWLSTYRHAWFWWPLFTLTGVAAMLLHTAAALMLVVQFFWLLLRKRLRALDGVLWGLAVSLMLVFPIWWYITQNRWITKATVENNSGVEWNQDYTAMDWHAISSLPLVHLFGYLWPVALPDGRLSSWLGLGPVFDQHLATRTVPWVISAEVWAGIALGAVLILGLLPWRGRRPGMVKANSALRGCWWYVPVWIGVPIGCLTLTWLPKGGAWYQFLWGWYDRANAKGIPPIWEPRYLGMVLPALILWLAAAMRRLPTAGLRIVAFSFVILISLISASTNYFIYRQTPWQPTAEVLASYGNTADADKRKSVALGTPFTRFPAAVDQIAYDLASKTVPDPEALDKLEFFPKLQWERALDDNAIVPFLDRVRRNPQVKIIVLTDRNGDVDEPPLSNASVNSRLGASWKLVHEESYRWYYEWRYYLFNTWRTRVWERQTNPPSAPSSPLSGPSVSPSARSVSPSTRASGASSAPAARTSTLTIPGTSRQVILRGGVTTAPATGSATAAATRPQP